MDRISQNNNQSLKIVFAGTPAFGLPALEAIYKSSHSLVAVYTQPDRPVGRGQKSQASPVKQWADSHCIPVFQPENFKTEESLLTLQALQPDIMVVIAYGLILPKKILDVPKFGCINVHASILPAWRGASPIQSALLHGDHITGVSIMQMDVGMDTGNVLATDTLDIFPDDTAGTLHDKLSLLAVNPLLQVLDQVLSKPLHGVSQDHLQVSYAKKILKEDAHISWQLDANIIDRQIRAYQPWPVAFALLHETPMRIYRATVMQWHGLEEPGVVIQIDTEGLLIACGHDALLVQEFQFPGGKKIAVSEWLRGHPGRISAGMKLT